MDIKNMLNDKIEMVNLALKDVLDVGEQEKLRRAVQHIPMAGGKRLRPVLAMLTADAISNSGKKALPFGITLELIHNFTLLHDDVMDKDELRRGVKTVHVLFDEATAINAGDVLFARAFETLTTTNVDGTVLKKLVREVAQAVRNIGEGQQLDKDFENRIDITEKDYMKMIEYKTARLFQIAAKGGAMIAEGTEEQIRSMTDYGRLLGIGFQIWDDYLDLKADENLLGKPVGSDIKNGKRTLMVVHVLGDQNASQQNVARAIEILDITGSTSYAEQMALDFAKKSKELLEVLPQSEHKDILGKITDYMVQRRE
jgi:geranylgeranyl diphosphate synthase type I